jgi:formate C-acetyltransferase
MNERIKSLRDASLEISGRFWERDLLWSRAEKQNLHIPPPLRRAHAMKHLAENVKLEIHPGQLIVGKVPLGEPPPNVVDELESLHQILAPHRPAAGFEELITREERRGLEGHAYTAGPMTGHTAIDAQKVLSRGLADIQDEVEERLRKLDPTSPESVDRRLFYRSCSLALEGAMTFAERYAAFAADMAGDQHDPERAAELREIARICRRVPAHPASTFHEALQSVWFMHWLVAAEQSAGHGCFCPGRLDRYCWPYLRGDLESGRLTEAEALELLECFFVRYGDWGPEQSPQVLIVGGQKPDGSDATNPLTQMCLRASRDLQTLHPALALSYNDQTPEDVLKEAVQTLQSGCAFPFFFNDEVIVPGLVDAGVAPGDATGYVPCACTEITVGGCTNAWVASGYHNWGKLMELALHDGRDPATGEQVGPHTGKFCQMQEFEELRRAVKHQISHFVEMEVRSYNLLDRMMGEHFPVPLLSCVVNDCLENGRDYFAGGARYNFIEPEAVGPTNVADSLAAVKTMVFEDGTLKPAKLLHALKDNFRDQETLRRRLLAAPKFGNDQAEVDSIAADLVDFWYEQVHGHRNYRNGPYLPGFLCWIMHGQLGRHVGALPDGRKAGEALAPHLGPHPGRDQNGPTAVINSVARCNLKHALGGIVLNLKFLPDQLEGQNLPKFLTFLRVAFEQGIAELQINVVNSELLREAQLEPEKHRGLVVRVGGYSAYFNTLDANIQDEIIARTEERL